MIRISAVTAALILAARRELRASDLGEVGARAIRQALLDRGPSSVPSLRTINRILANTGERVCRRRAGRTRPPPPPRGWYLPDLAAGRCELDSFDLIERLATRDGRPAQVLNGVSLHGGLTNSWPVAGPVRARRTVAYLTEHWRAAGLPAYAQFDNDPVFQGTHNSPVALGRVIRLCLSLAVVPVFVPPGELGFQSMIEGYNAWWRCKVWARFDHAAIGDLQERSRRYVAATRVQRAHRIELAPARRPFPAPWRFDVYAPPRGRIVYLRRTNAAGELCLFGRTWRLSENRPGRLVRVELDLTHELISVVGLNRNRPWYQPELLEAHFRLPLKPFQG
jgi:hypothetical protein